MKNILLILLGICLVTNHVFAKNAVVIPLYLTVDSGQGEFIGTVAFIQQQRGILIMPHLKKLSPGIHGFHLHQNPSCDAKGLAAGGHFDPQNTHQHLGPYNDQGHLGDLPVLIVNDSGLADLPIFAPRLKLSDLAGHSVVVHAGGDNYADRPEKLGGGGARIACGIFTK